jgi:hypothetical protein
MFRKRVHSSEPLYLFLTGGARIGKTFTFKLLVQGLLRIYNKYLDSDLQKVKAILMAFTGKATFNIDGSTIHSALHIPVNHSLTNILKLSFETLNNLTGHYEQLRLVVIDEISLVGWRMMNAIDQRLRDIKHIHNSFLGNLDIIVT